MFCAKCGRPLAAHAAFCASCGAAAGEGQVLPDMGRPGVVTFIAVLDILGGLLFGASAAAMLFFSLRAGGDEDMAFALVYGAIVGVFAVAALVAGIGLFLMRPFGRVVQIVLSCIGLLGFPLGTIINGLILYYLLTPGVRVLFSGKAAEELTPIEVAAVVQTRGGAAAAIAIVLIAIVGIGVIGIMSAIAIPNLLTAMQRSKQKRTMADIRSIATAVEAYAVDNNRYPEGSLEELAPQIEGGYIKTLPRMDGWETPMLYRGIDCQRGACQGYMIASGGKNGELEVDLDGDLSELGPIDNFNGDIIYSNGTFISWPSEMSSN